MKKIAGGMGFMLTGTLLYISACLVGYLNYENTTEWSTGRYWQSIINAGLLPAVIMGFAFLIIGAILTLWGVFSKPDK